MRSTVLTVLLMLSALGATAGQIEGVAPKAVTAGSGEQFINISGSDLGDHVLYSGKAGEFDVEVSARGERNVVAYVPDEIANTPGRYTIYVRGEKGTAGPVSFDVFDPSQPLVLLVPDPIAEPSTSRSGAAVNFEVWPFGGPDPRPDVSCSQKSGSLFPLGSTVVDCTASNSNGEKVTGQVSITVFDDLQTGEGLQLHIPEIVVAEAESLDGARVKFEVSADGTRDSNPEVKCDPESGSQFRMGNTSVVCVAKDSLGNSAVGKFEVAVVDRDKQ